MAEGEPKVTAVDVLDGDGHLTGRKQEVEAPLLTPAHSRGRGPGRARTRRPSSRPRRSRRQTPSERLNTVTLQRTPSQLCKGAPVFKRSGARCQPLPEGLDSPCGFGDCPWRPQESRLAVTYGERRTS